MKHSTTFKFTIERIEKLAAPSDGEATFRDTEVRGLQVRVRASGAMTYEVRYRVGGGRGAPMRRHTIGPCQRVSLAAARKIASEVLARARNGHDPSAERRVEAIKAKGKIRDRTESVIGSYVDQLRAEGVVATNQIESLLRRELAWPLGRDRNLSTVSRADPHGAASMRSQRAAAKVSRLCFAHACTGPFTGSRQWIDPHEVFLAGARRRRGTRRNCLKPKQPQEAECSIWARFQLCGSRRSTEPPTRLSVPMFAC